MSPIEIITQAINSYNQHRSNISTIRLQEIREDIAINAFKLSELYAEHKIAAESAEYRRKKCISIHTLHLKENSEKRLTREDLQARCLIHCEQAYQKEHEAKKEYEIIRQVSLSCQQVLNAISSRINILTR